MALPIQEAGACLAAFGPLVILDYLFQYLSCVLRMSFENQRYAALQTANTVSYFIAACAGAYVGGIYGTVAGRYIAYGASIVLGMFFLKKTGIAIPFKLATSPFPKRDLWKYSVSTQVSASLNTLTFLLDVLLVGFFIQNAAVVATYKTATIIPEGLVFIPTSVITFALPYFVKHNRDGVWFREKKFVVAWCWAWRICRCFFGADYRCTLDCRRFVGRRILGCSCAVSYPFPFFFVQRHASNVHQSSVCCSCNQGELSYLVHLARGKCVVVCAADTGFRHCRCGACPAVCLGYCRRCCLYFTKKDCKKSSRGLVWIESLMRKKSTLLP